MFMMFAKAIQWYGAWVEPRTQVRQRMEAALTSSARRPTRGASLDFLVSGRGAAHGGA
jgi:hypothetical protein